MSMVRAPRHPASDRRPQAQHWLVIGGLILLLAPLALPSWAAGLAVLRTGRVRKRWLLSIAGAIVFIHLARRGFRLDAVVAEHFTFWRKVLPAWMEEAGKAHPEPFRRLGPGFILSGVLGSAWLSVPAGLVFACGSMYARKASPPEWSAQAQAQRDAERASSLGVASQRALTPPDAGVFPPVLGVVQSGDLAWTVAARTGRKPGAAPLWLQFPPETLDLPRVLVGQPGYGKTFAFLRIVYMYAALGYQVVFVDGKGTDPTLPARVVAAFRHGGGGDQMLIYPDEPADMWRGSPRDVVQKVLSVWTFAEQHEYFQAIAENALSLALEVPGIEPVRSSHTLLERLTPAELTRLHKRYGTTETRATLSQIIALRDQGLAGFAMRLRSLLRSVGPSLDGGQSFEDVDLAVLTVPSGLKRKDASAIMRVLLEEFGMYASGRKGTRPCLLIFDEFSALQGGRGTATDLVERLRSTSTEVMLGVQSFEGLGGSGPGSMWEALRILNACSGGLLLFRTPSPDNFVRLAGSVQQPDVSHNLDHFGLTDRGLVRSTGKFRVDPDHVRQLVPGQGYYISGGRAALTFVATTPGLEGFAAEEAEAFIAEAHMRGQRAERLRRIAEQEGTEDDQAAS